MASGGVSHGADIAPLLRMPPPYIGMLDLAQRWVGPPRAATDVRVWKMSKDWQGHRHAPALDRTPDILTEGGTGRYNWRGWDSMVAYFDHLLDRTTSEQCHGLSRWLQRLQIHYCSICCGSGQSTLIMKQFQEALHKKLGVDANIVHSFSCEIEADKQRHSLKTVNPKVLFKDAHSLSGTYAADAALSEADATSPVPRYMDLVLAGFPCQDVSTLNPAMSAASSCCRDGSHRTGGIFRSIVSFAKSRRAWQA